MLVKYLFPELEFTRTDELVDKVFVFREALKEIGYEWGHTR